MILFGLTLSAFAESAKNDFSIEELIAEALSQNPELRFYEAEVSAAKGQRTQAGLWKNPEVSGEYGEKRVKEDSSLTKEGYSRGISIAQTFEFPGKGSLRKAIAAKNTELAEMGLAQFRLALASKVDHLGHEYAASDAQAAFAEEFSERSTNLIETLKKRAVAGPQALVELQVIEGSLLELQATSKEFMQRREQLRIELNSLLGRPVNLPLTVKTVPTPPHVKLDTQLLVAISLENNIPLKMRKIEVERSKSQVTEARLETAPDLTAGPFVHQETAREKETTVGIQFSMPLPFWDWNQGNVQTAKARLEQADASLQEEQRKIEREVAIAVRNYDLTSEQLEKSSSMTVEKLREAAEYTDRRYRLGAINVQLYLEAQRQLLLAYRIRSEAVQEAWHLLHDLKLLTAGELQIAHPHDHDDHKQEGK